MIAIHYQTALFLVRAGRKELAVIELRKALAEANRTQDNQAKATVMGLLAIARRGQ